MSYPENLICHMASTICHQMNTLRYSSHKQIYSMDTILFGLNVTIRLPLKRYYVVASVKSQGKMPMHPYLDRFDKHGISGSLSPLSRRVCLYTRANNVLQAQPLDILPLVPQRHSSRLNCINWSLILSKFHRSTMFCGLYELWV